jgi:pyruvate dehydrogenase E1 component
MRRMFAEQEDVFYYLTVMNENYEHPEMPAGAEADIIKGMYAFRRAAKAICASSCWLRHHLPRSDRRRRPAQERLGRRSRHLGLPELQRTGPRRPGRRPLEPAAPARSAEAVARRAEAGRRRRPVVAATDYIKLFAEQIRPFVKNTYVTLGTDGFGRSDTREKLRHFFEVDRHWVTLAALKALADEGKIEREGCRCPGQVQP